MLTLLIMTMLLLSPALAQIDFETTTSQPSSFETTTPPQPSIFETTSSFDDTLQTSERLDDDAQPKGTPDESVVMAPDGDVMSFPLPTSVSSMEISDPSSVKKEYGEFKLYT